MKVMERGDFTYPDHQIHDGSGSGTNVLVVEITVAKDLIGKLAAVGYVCAFAVFHISTDREK